MRAATLARFAVGGACVVAPRLLLETIGAPDHDDRRVHGVVRALGARLVLQGAVDRRRGRGAPGLDVTIELMHAASMLPAAVLWPAHRRAALVSAAVACTIALVDVVDAGSNAPSDARPRRG